MWRDKCHGNQSEILPKLKMLLEELFPENTTTIEEKVPRQQPVPIATILE
jgi:hypothetical protein